MDKHRDRRWADEQLRKQWHNYAPVMHRSPIAMIMTDVDSVVVYWNPAAERLFGYTADEAVGRSVDDLVAGTETLHAEAVRIGEETFRRGVNHVVTRRTRKDGTLVDVELLSAPLVIAENPLGLIAIYHDVSEMKRQKQYYQSLLEVSPSAIVTIDRDAMVTAWNPAAERLFGYTADEAIGRNVDDLIAMHNGIREEAVGYSEQAWQGHIQAHVRRNRKDGSLVDVALLAAPVVVSGEHVGTYAIYNDIGELVSARREAEAASHAKGAFLATMSHEIRTPMNAVIGMTELLSDTVLSAEQHKYVQIIRDSGDALLRIIDDILDFSKIEAGRMELENEPFVLARCVESAFDLVAARASEKGLDLAYSIEPGVPEALFGDTTRVRQVLVNLLGNAVKFTERGEVELVVSAEPADATEPGDAADGGWTVRFSVRDTGIGIPADVLGSLFESFRQVDATTTRRYGGTGLGLAISRHLAEMMGGTAWAESQEGTGSTFNFTIAAKAAPKPHRPYEYGSRLELAARRVLVVDDNATNRHIIGRHLAAAGMEAVEARTPREALAWIRRGDPFDVAILDMKMPEMDGVMLAEQIRQHRDDNDLPLIMVTSLGRESRGLDQFAAVLTKPVRPSQLYDSLLIALGGKADAPVMPAEPIAEAPHPTAAAEPLRILVAEDNAVNQRLALLMLEKIGHSADVATTGYEVLEALGRKTYDVVLMDIQMPELDGLEACRRIRAEWPPDQQPHVVAMTANVLADDRELALAAGMDDFLGKPVRLNELAEALARVRHGQTVLDPDALRTLEDEVGSDGLAAVIDTFRTESVRLLEVLHEALTRGDEDEARRAAHTLKSNSAYLGATALTNLSREIEALSRDKNLTAAVELLAQLDAEHTRVQEAVERMRRG